MKALLLAGGLGSRLRPLTDTIPKCLVPIQGKPLLEIWLETLTKAGVTDFLINTHYLSSCVEAFVAKSPYKDRITLVHEETLLGTGGTLLANKAFFDTDKPFMVIHADNLSVCDYKDFISAHFLRPPHTCMTMMTFHTTTPKSCGVLVLHSDKTVKEFHEKVQNPPTSLANGAVYIFEYEIFDTLSSLSKNVIDLSTEVIPLLLPRIYTYFNERLHIDIGTPESYTSGQKLYHDITHPTTFSLLRSHFNNPTHLRVFKSKITEITKRIRDHKMVKYKHQRVLAIYDFIDLPFSNDIITFLIAAQSERLSYGLEKIDVVFMAQAEDPSPTRHPYVTPENYKQFIYNFALEQARVIPFIGSIFVFDNRCEFDDFFNTVKNSYHLFPKDYSPTLPIEEISGRPPIHQWSNIAPILEKNPSLLCLTPPSDQVTLARRWIKKYIYPKIPITITLREWSDWADERNSQIPEWQKLVESYQDNPEFYFIVIRDYYQLYAQDDPLHGDNVVYCHEAALSNSFRAALYQEVTLNLFVSNGCGVYAIANHHVRYIFFSIHSNGRGATRETLRDVLNLYYGESFQGATSYQKVVWERDTFEVLKKETDSMLAHLKTTVGLNPLWYSNESYIPPISLPKTLQNSIENRIPLRNYILISHWTTFVTAASKSYTNIITSLLHHLNTIQMKLRTVWIKGLLYVKTKGLILKKDYPFLPLKGNSLTIDNATYPSILSTPFHGKKVVIYGAGSIGLLAEEVLNSHVLCFIDNNVYGTLPSSLPKEVYPLSALEKISYDYILITPRGREKEIIQNLLINFHIPKEKILVF